MLTKHICASPPLPLHALPPLSIAALWTQELMSRSIRLAYPSSVESHYKTCHFNLCWRVLRLLLWILRSPPVVTRAGCWFFNKVGANIQLTGTKFDRGWDQLMYGSLTLLCSAHKLLSNVVVHYEICDKYVTFSFYTGLPHLCRNQSSPHIHEMQWTLIWMWYVEMSVGER